MWHLLIYCSWKTVNSKPDCEGHVDKILGPISYGTLKLPLKYYCTLIRWELLKFGLLLAEFTMEHLIEQYWITLLAWEKKKQGEKTDVSVSFYTANSSQLHVPQEIVWDILTWKNLSTHVLGYKIHKKIIFV